MGGYPLNYKTWYENASKSWEPEMGIKWVWADVDGTGLHDVINSNFPFTRMNLQNREDGFTHAEMLELTNPLSETVPYTYDTLEPTTVSRGKLASIMTGSSADSSVETQSSEAAVQLPYTWVGLLGLSLVICT